MKGLNNIDIFGVVVFFTMLIFALRGMEVRLTERIDRIGMAQQQYHLEYHSSLEELKRKWLVNFDFTQTKVAGAESK